MAWPDLWNGGTQLNELAMRQARGRIAMVLGVMGLLSIGLLIQLIRVQFGTYAPIFAARSEASLERVERVVPDRGLIYDREGRMLATNAVSFHIEVEVRQLTDRSREDIAAVLSKLLVLPFEDLHAQLARDWASLGQFRVRLTRVDDAGDRWPITLDQSVADVLNGFLADPTAPDLSGLSLVPAPRRVYPTGTLTGHVLGFVNEEGKGYFGIEGFYDEWLSGKPITINRPLIPPLARLQPDPPAGVNLVLTIDTEIQQMVDSVLVEAIDTSGAASGQIIVMDPRNGEILAMSSWPQLDPNDYEPWLEEEDEDPVISPAASAQYEPGSTFKVLTMAAALDSGAVAPDQIFIDTGQIEVGGHPIRNWNGEAWGPQTMTGCLRHSLNVCLAYVASQELGAADFYGYMNAFGLGQLTGIDLAGEVPGQLRTPRHVQWTESDLGTNSFGQGVSVTPIQLLTAVTAVANEGVMVQPHLVRQVAGPQGVYWPKTTVLGQPVSAETAHTLTAMLTQSLDGETQYAKVEGYELAGKTGTAQVPTDLGYDPNLTVASFIGWGPVSDPQFIVLVRIDKPTISPWGSVVAAPIFQDVVERLVVFLGIPPDVQPVQQASIP
jgi:cell division protein FtsI/penicillin-binding protein 2